MGLPRIGFATRIGVLLAAVTGWRCFSGRATQSRDYVLPDTFTGWVFVEYGVSSATPIPEEDGRELVTVPTGGHVQTPVPFRSVRLDHRYRRADGTAIPSLVEERLSGDQERETVRATPFVCCFGTAQRTAGDGLTRTFDYFYVGRGPAGERAPLPD